MKNWTIRQLLQRAWRFLSKRRRPWRYVLDDNYNFKTRLRPPAKAFTNELLTILPCGRVYITKSYAWDGCTPSWPVFGLFYIGTPEGIHGKDGKPKTYWASLIHDALYQFQAEHKIPYKELDEVFYEELQASEFAQVWCFCYWVAVRIFSTFFKKEVN